MLKKKKKKNHQSPLFPGFLFSTLGLELPEQTLWLAVCFALSSLPPSLYPSLPLSPPFLHFFLFGQKCDLKVTFPFRNLDGRVLALGSLEL